MTRVPAVMLLFAVAVMAHGREAPDARGEIRLAAAKAQVLFTPGDDVEAAVTAAIRGAQTQVLVQAFSFTSRPIARALIDARARGVDVRVTADQGETERILPGRIAELAATGIPVWIETRYQSAHNKVMVIDSGTAGATVITGSFNWTYAAQRRNAENVLILKGQLELAQRYKANWERHQAQAQPYRRSK